MEIFIGIIAGVISAMGMGGGSILIFLLTNISGLEYHVAQGTNLIFFIPTSIAAIIINLKNKNIELKIALVLSFFGIVGAIIGAKIAIYIDVDFLKKVFGVFLGIISINEIYTIYKLYKVERKK